MILTAVDPGPTESGVVVMNDGDIVLAVVERSLDLAGRIAEGREAIDRLVIEDIQSYGKPVGREVFETAMMIGELRRAYRPRAAILIGRRDVKRVLCGGPTFTDPMTLKKRGVQDAHIKAAIIERYGGDDAAIGAVKCPKCKGKGWFGAGRPPCPECETGWRIPPGPLHGVQSHAWSALAIALTFMELHHEGHPRLSSVR